MENITFRSPNIDCPHCIENIKRKIGNTYGVSEVQGDPVKKQVTITYDPSQTTPDNLKEAMADAGYPIAA